MKSHNKITLPITVVLPCRNNRIKLKDHTNSILSWLQRVEQVVVVDSSSDGSLDYLRERLAASHVEFYSLPPGLYQAWNFGIERARASFCYFSTVGDFISAEGLEHLYEIASKNSIDLVLSPPRMVDVDEAPTVARWPIHEIADSLHADFFQPDRGETLRWLTCFLPFTILGSSASNLYRTALLKANRFPTEFSHNGDAALGAKIAPFVKMGITKKICSRFVTHGPGREISAYEQAETAKKFLTLLQEVSHMSPPEGAAALAMSRSILENKIGLLDWLANLEAAVKDQKDYIKILESQNATLREEHEVLSRMAAGIPVPFVKAGHLLSLKRFLKRKLRNRKL
jgi:hypothetical protein